MDELLSHTGDSPLPLRVGGHVDQGQENVLRLVVKNLAECWWWVGRLHFEPGFTGIVVGNNKTTEKLKSVILNLSDVCD